MMRFVVFFILSALVHCRLEMGKERFSLTNKTFNYQQRRTFYGGSNVTVSVECGSGNGKVIGDFAIMPLLCQPSNNSVKPTLSRQSVVCHEQVETFGDLSKYFSLTGVYALNFSFTPKVPVTLTLEFGSKFNYLTPKDYPLFVFYSVMCVVYSIYALVWLVLCCCHWRELLRIQFWIGGVILLGMLEKAMFVGEYDAVRRFGETTGSMLMAAEVVSSLKRTLSRMLVIIVSLGFGIVKPRLGADLHKVTLVGIIFFIVSCADGIVRCNDEDYSDRVLTVLRLMLSITDAIIFLWIFYSIVKTISLLTLRKNLVKLNLYRHFRNVLIFSVLASVVFMVGLYVKDRFLDRGCLWDRMLDEQWWEDAFWSLLFSVILLAIIVLWRPSANNQRYAYSPLQDIDEDDADQLTECTNEGLGVSKRGNENFDNLKKSTNNEDDDLKWVEDNIPKSIIDSALSNLVESDEEINQKKFEISKML